MHELSIVMSIIQIAEKESAKNNAAGVDEIELEIGDLSGIEMTAFDFAWAQAIRSTLLEKAKERSIILRGKENVWIVRQFSRWNNYTNPARYAATIL